MQLKLILLGSPQIECNGENVNGRLPTKARTLLYYLANNPQPHNRDQLAEWIWEGMANPRGSLRVALTTIRRHLGKDFFAGGRDGLTINKKDNYMLDVEEFDNFIRLAEKVTGATERAHLRDAVALFRGDFLQNVTIDSTYLYDEWLVPERERLRQQALAAYDRLVEICREQGDYEAGIRYALALLQLEPWRESAHRQLMRFYHLTGKRELAIKQFDSCADVLEKEFGLSPTDETFALYRQIVDPQAVGVTEPLTAPEEAESQIPFLAPKLVPFFSGRDAELADLQEKLLPRDARRVYGLVGPPGVGKSALAIELAHRLRNVFPDGVLWMHANLDDPMSVAERWANAYGHDFSRISDLNERTAVLRDLLSEKQSLIICDDVTSAAKTRPFLPEGCRCTILLTSRSENIIHKLGAELVDVCVLSVENGRSLLTSIISEERVAAEEAAAAEILTLLEGLPLAISIAGQRLALRSRRKLASYADQLRNESVRIDLADRDRAIRTSFAVSWNALDQWQQHVFTLAAVFAGRSFAINAAAAIAEMDYYEVLERLDDLTALSLLNDVGDERYRHHALLADFAHEKLGDDDAPSLRMIAYFQAFAADHQADYAKLELEWENLSASIEQAQQMALWPAVLALTDTLQPAWFRRGRYHEARRAFLQAVTAAKALDDQLALAQCLYHWGYICWEQNDWDEAGEKLSASLNLFEAFGDLAGVAKAQLQLSVLATDRTNYAEASQYLAACRQVREKLDDKVGIAEIISREAQLQYVKGDLEGAKFLSEQALQIQESLGDKLGELRTLRKLATTIKHLNHDLELEKRYIQRAVILADELQDQVERAVIYKHMFEISWREGNHQLAEEFASKSLDMLGKMGDRRIQAMVYYLLSKYKQQLEDYNKALEYGNKSLEICRSLGDKAGITFSLQRLGKIFACLNMMHEACTAWKEALKNAYQLENNKLLQELSNSLKRCSDSGKV